MDIESVVLVISVILLFVIGYVAVGVLIPDPRKINRAVFAYLKSDPAVYPSEDIGIDFSLVYLV